MVNDSRIYESPDESSDFDSLEAHTIVKIVSQSEGEFVLVEFEGDIFYIKTANLQEI